MTPEGKVKDYLISKAAQMGLKAFKCSFDNRNGAPDWLVIGNGKAVWLELKSKHGRLSLAQKKMHALLSDYGGAKVFVVSDELGVNQALMELMV